MRRLVRSICSRVSRTAHCCAKLISTEIDSGEAASLTDYWGVCTHIGLIQIRYQFVRVVEVHTWNQILGTGHIHTPELATHHSVFQFLYVGVGRQPFALEVMAINLALQLLPDQEWEIIVAIDQCGALQNLLCSGVVVVQIDGL